MIANVHPDPGSSLRNLREQLHDISRRLPGFPVGLGIPIGNFNICEPEERRFNVTAQTFSDGDPGGSATLRSVCPNALEIGQPSFTKKEVAPTERYDSYPGFT